GGRAANTGVPTGFGTKVGGGAGAGACVAPAAAGGLAGAPWRQAAIIADRVGTEATMATRRRNLRRSRPRRCHSSSSFPYSLTRSMVRPPLHTTNTTPVCCASGSSAAFVMNGVGKARGLPQVAELGVVETPILLT